MITEEQKKAIAIVKEKKKKKKGTSKAKKEVDKAKKESAVAVEEKKDQKKPKNAPPKEKKKDVTKPKVEKKPAASKLPSAIAEKKVFCTSSYSPQPLKVAIKDVRATSKQVYVDDIHHLNPTVLETNYMLILKNNPHVVVRVTEEVHSEVVQLTGAKISHLYSAVDCSVIPTLSYGSWKLTEIKDELPSVKQIAEQDVELKNNPAYVHNPPIKVELYVDKKDEEAEEETFDFFNEEDEEEDDAFDFGEEEED